MFISVDRVYVGSPDKCRAKRQLERCEQRKHSKHGDKELIGGSEGVLSKVGGGGGGATAPLPPLLLPLWKMD